ncbi:hypothetical protein JVU11DRAFT_10072 [Chiua virens]|nr:hypothetical protein JVU11DRAFT_10072 [Chiua virens]
MEVAQGPGMQSISKTLRDMKVKDLPIEDNLVTKYQWDILICLLVDWAGSTDDPFGTNKNLDLMPTIQQLWDNIFDLGDACLDVTKYPAIKKNSKRRIYCLEQYFKASEYIKDHEPWVAFVKSQVPFICDSNDKPMFPLIYKDPESMKGAWEAPLMTSILAKHLQQMGANQFLAFGKPFGALALCAASLKRALELFRGGKNVKNILNFTGDGDSQGHQSGKNQFNHKFAMAARQYASSTSGLSENKWKKIISLMQTLSAADLTGADQDAIQVDGVCQNEEYLTAARAQIQVSESKSEETSTGMNGAGKEAGLDGAGDEKAGIDDTEGEEADTEGVDGGQGRAAEDVEDEDRSHSGWHGDSEDGY